MKFYYISHFSILTKYRNKILLDFTFVWFQHNTKEKFYPVKNFIIFFSIYKSHILYSGSHLAFYGYISYQVFHRHTFYTRNTVSFPFISRIRRWVPVVILGDKNKCPSIVRWPTHIPHTYIHTYTYIWSVSELQSRLFSLTSNSIYSHAQKCNIFSGCKNEG